MPEDPSTSGISKSLSLSLRDSRFLLLITTPGALESPWIGHEVKEFLATHSPAHVIFFAPYGASQEILDLAVELVKTLSVSSSPDASASFRVVHSDSPDPGQISIHDLQQIIAILADQSLNEVVGRRRNYLLATRGIAAIAVVVIIAVSVSLLSRPTWVLVRQNWFDHPVDASKTALKGLPDNQVMFNNSNYSYFKIFSPDGALIDSLASSLNSSRHPPFSTGWLDRNGKYIYFVDGEPPRVEVCELTSGGRTIHQFSGRLPIVGATEFAEPMAVQWWSNQHTRGLNLFTLSTESTNHLKSMTTAVNEQDTLHPLRFAYQGYFFLLSNGRRLVARDPQSEQLAPDLWSLDSGKLLGSLTLMVAPASSSFFCDPSRDLFATIEVASNGDGVVALWDVVTCTPSLVPISLSPMPEYTRIRLLVNKPDSMAYIGIDALYSLNLRSGELQQIASQGEWLFKAADVLEEGIFRTRPFLAWNSVATDTSFCLDFARSASTALPERLPLNLPDLFIEPGSDRLLVQTANSITMWSLTNGRRIAHIRCKASPGSISLTLDRTSVAIGMEDGSLRCYALGDGALVAVLPKLGIRRALLDIRQSEKKAVVWTDNGRVLSLVQRRRLSS